MQGVAIQSYLRRSHSDLLHLMENSANIRIVKGAYSEDKNEAYQSNNETTQIFSRLMKVILKKNLTRELWPLLRMTQVLLMKPYHCLRKDQKN